MYRERNWTNDDLRAKFLQLAEGEGWFDPSEEADAAERWQALQLLFGQPPYEFLEPGDPLPERLRGSETAGRPLGRRVVADPEEAGARRGVAGYSRVGKKAQLVDSLDKDKARHYWLRGIELAQVTTSRELFEAMRHASSTREVELAFRRPIRAHRANAVEAPSVGEQLTLYTRPKKRPAATAAKRRLQEEEGASGASAAPAPVPPSVRATVTASLVKTGYATGTVTVQLTSAAGGE